MFDFIDQRNAEHGLTAVNKQSTFAVLPQFAELGQQSHGKHNPHYGDPETLSKVYEKIVWFHRCIDIIATNIAGLPKRIVIEDDEGNQTDITENQEFLVFREPNEWQTHYDFWYESISRLRLQGELFWELQTMENSDKIISIFSDWASQEVQIITHPELGPIAYKRRTAGGKTLTFDASEVFCLKYFNPNDSIRGLPPSRAARDSMALYLQSMEFNQTFFENGMQWAGFMTTDEDIAQKEAERVERTLERKWSGVNKMHRVPIIPHDMKFMPLNGSNHRDAQFAELMEMSREDICISQGIHPEAVGLGQRTYENVGEARRLMWAETLVPIIRKLTDQVNKFLLPRLTNTPGAQLVIDTSGVEALKEDRSKLMKDYREGFMSGAISPNDIRVDVFGKDPLDGEHMDTTYLPFNTSPADMAGEEFNQPPAAQPEPDKIVKWAGFDLDVNWLDKQYIDKTMLWVQKASRVEAQERKFRKEMKKFFSKQRTDVVRRVNAQKALSKNEDITLASLFDEDFWNEQLEEITDPLILAAFEEGVAEIMSIDDFDFTHDNVRGVLGQRTEDMAKFTNSHTAEKITKQLQEWSGSGESVSDLAKRIRDNVFADDINNVRANRIARTEAVGSNNFGTHEGIRQSDAFERKMWITSRDTNVRSAHIPMDGIVVKLEDSFDVDGGVDYPQAINERCFLIGTLEAVT